MYKRQQHACVTHERQRADLLDGVELRPCLHRERLPVLGDAARRHEHAALLQRVRNRLSAQVLLCEPVAVRSNRHPVAAGADELRLAHAVKIIQLGQRNAIDESRGLFCVGAARRRHRDLHDGQIVDRARHHLLSLMHS